MRKLQTKYDVNKSVATLAIVKWEETQTEGMEEVDCITSKEND